MKMNPPLTCDPPPVPDQDIERIARAVAEGRERRFRGLRDLLTDPRERLALLDQTVIQEAVKSLRDTITDSLYCYVEVRSRLLSVGIGSREVAFYLANIWTNYRETGILPELDAESGQFIESVDILKELSHARGYAKFELLAMCGNYYLFLMAFFEGYFLELEKLSGKPAFAYYETFARIAFRAARDHGLEEEFELRTVYNELCSRFSEVREALAGLAP